FGDAALPAPAQKIDKASRGRLSSVIKRGDLDATAGASLLLHDLPGIAARGGVLVSLGGREAFGDKAFRDALAGAARALAGGAAKDAVLAIAAEVPGRSLAWRLRQASRMLADS